MAATRTVRMAGSGLTELPPLEDPETIATLDVSDNRLTSLPSLPPNLTMLLCYNNQLTELPELPPTLVRFAANNNRITRIPRIPDSVMLMNMGNNPLLEPDATWYEEYARRTHDIDLLRQRVNGALEKKKGKEVANLRLSQLDKQLPEDVVKNIGSMFSAKKGTLKQQGLQLRERASRMKQGVGGRKRKQTRRRRRK